MRQCHGYELGITRRTWNDAKFGTSRVLSLDYLRPLWSVEAEKCFNEHQDASGSHAALRRRGVSLFIAKT